MLIFNYGKTEKGCSEAALLKQQENVKKGMRPLLLSARHIGTLQLMEKGELKEHGSIIIDEASLLNRVQAEFLCYVADKLDICVEVYGLRLDEKGQIAEGAVYIMAHAESIEAVAEKDVPKEEQQEDIAEQVSPYLLEFLEAEGYSEKLTSLRRNSRYLDEGILSAMAVVLDTELPQDYDIEAKKETLIQYLETKIKYEVIR